MKTIDEEILTSFQKYFQETKIFYKKEYLEDVHETKRAEFILWIPLNGSINLLVLKKLILIVQELNREFNNKYEIDINIISINNKGINLEVIIKRKEEE